MDTSRALSRRALLALAASGVATSLAGCTDSQDAPSPATATPTSADGTAVPDGDLALVAAAVGDEAALADFCRAIRRRHPSLREALAPIQERQEAIVAALRDSVSELSAPQVPAGEVPRRPRQAVRELIQRQSASERDRFDDCLAAESGLLARLFASTSASHAVAVEQVRALR